MKIDRPINHFAYFHEFEAHNPNCFSKPQHFELFIKLNALLWRGLIISDSDLNNNPLFSFLSNTSETKKLLENAINSGFIKRAARYDEGGAITQAKLFEEFSERSPGRASRIDTHHPNFLDSVFSSSEITYSPCIWDKSKTGEIFGNRIKIELKDLELTKWGKRKRKRITDYVNRFKRTNYTGLFAATIEKKFCKKWKQNEEINKIWNAILRAYNGNFLVSLGKKFLAVNSCINNQSLYPSIRGTDEARIDFLDGYYESWLSNSIEKFYELNVVEISPKIGTAINYVLDIGKLLELNFNDIEEIRENANPNEYFQKRFEQHICEEEEGFEIQKSYLENQIAYWDRLLSSCEAKKVESIEKESVKNYMLYLEVFRDEKKKDAISDLGKTTAGLITSPFPLVGNITSLSLFATDSVSLAKNFCEIEIMKQGKGEVANKLKEISDNSIPRILNIPDFEIIKKIGEKI